MGLSDEYLAAVFGDTAPVSAHRWEAFTEHYPVLAELVRLRARERDGQMLRPGELLAELSRFMENRIAQGASGREREVIEEMSLPLLTLWHRCEEWSQMGLGWGQITREIDRSVHEKRREPELPPPQSEGLVRVLSIHGSKGLEFPRVILLDFGKRPKASGLPLLYWQRGHGALLQRRDSEGKRLSDDDIEAPWKARERAADLAENRRVFYVALTRARDQLVMVFEDIPEPKEPKAGVDPVEAALARDDWRAWVDFLGDAQELDLRGQSAASSQVPVIVASNQPRQVMAAPHWRRARHSVTEWSLLERCERAYDWTWVAPFRKALGLVNPDALVGEPPDAWAFEQAFEAPPAQEPNSAPGATRDLGTRVHEILERAKDDPAALEDLEGIEEQYGARRFRAEPVIQWWKENQATWASWPERHAEWAFEARVGGDGALVGSIDLLEGREGQLRVTDFKITGSRREAEDLRLAYQAQLELYAWAVGQTMGLEAGSRQVSARIVHIHPEGVSEIDIPLKGVDPARLSERVDALLLGAPAEPKPSSLCGVCKHRASCSDALR